MAVKPPLRGVKCAREDHVGAALEHLELGAQRPRRPPKVGRGDDVEHGLAGRGDAHAQRSQRAEATAESEIERQRAPHHEHVADGRAADARTDTHDSAHARSLMPPDRDPFAIVRRWCPGGRLATRSAHTLGPVPPTYRQRLRIEGLGLALCGAIGTIVLLAVSAQAHGDPLSTAGQLAVRGAAPRVARPALGARRAIAASESRSERDLGSGEPTPVWRLPLIVVVLAGAAGWVAGWDAGVRVTGGCVLVGLAQALVLERVVAADEDETGRKYFRIAGSRILRGTRLGYIGGDRAASRHQHAERRAHRRAASAVSATLQTDPETSSAPPSRRRPAAAARTPAKRTALVERAA